MNQITRVLVALDYSTMDDQLLTFSRQLTELMDVEEIYFVHVIPDLFFPNKSEMPLAGDLLVSAPIDEKVEITIKKKVARFFTNHPNKITISVDILEGVPFEKILNWISIKHIDLLVTGRKKQSEGSGLTAKRVAHQTDCHVLFVPEESTLSPKNIMVPIDFSVHSVNAIRMALAFKRRIPNVNIQVVHSMRFLSYDYYYGLDDDPIFRKAFQAQKMEDYETMLEEHHLTTEDIELVFLDNPQINAARDLHEYAKEEKADLVIMGAKGHTGFKYFFYGSVTERFVGLCESIPIFVVR